MKNISILFLLILAFGLSGCFFQEENPEEKEALERMISAYSDDTYEQLGSFTENKKNNPSSVKGLKALNRCQKEFRDSFIKAKANTISELGEVVRRQEEILGHLVRDSLQKEDYRKFRAELFKHRVPDTVNVRDKLLYFKLNNSLIKWACRSLYLENTGNNAFKVMGMTDTLSLGEEYIGHIRLPLGAFPNRYSPSDLLTGTVLFNGKPVHKPQLRIEQFCGRSLHFGRMTQVFKFQPEKIGEYQIIYRLDRTSYKQVITFNVVQK